MILHLFILVLVSFGNCSYPPREVKCLDKNHFLKLIPLDGEEIEICKRVVQELEKEISKVNPNHKINLGHRINSKGEVIQKTKKFARSEIHISELMDSICDKMDNYVRAKKKDTGKLDVIQLISDSGLMNPNVGDYDIIQDSDLNKSLKFYCESIIEEFDSEIYDNLSKEIKDSEAVICIEATKLCDSFKNAKNEL